jgi:hypothetical protein
VLSASCLPFNFCCIFLIKLIGTLSSNSSTGVYRFNILTIWKKRKHCNILKYQTVSNSNFNNDDRSSTAITFRIFKQTLNLIVRIFLLI